MIRPLLLATALVPALHAAPVFQPIQAFPIAPQDSRGALVLAGDGNFYGTSTSGGSEGLGTIFRMTPAGEVTAIHSLRYVDGTAPVRGLTLGLDGDLYGTTATDGMFGNGTFFKISTAGQFTILAHLHGIATESDGPLVRGLDGNFYAINSHGGALSIGSIVRYTPAGVVTTVFDFNGVTGSYPHDGLTLGSDGNFYGAMTDGVPVGSPQPGPPVIFRYIPGGGIQTVAYLPYVAYSPLVTGQDGALYYVRSNVGLPGVPALVRVTTSGQSSEVPINTSIDSGARLTRPVLTPDGGFAGSLTAGATGIIYRLTTGGAFSVLQQSQAAPAPGDAPRAEMVADDAGNLYGTCFKITASGRYTLLETLGISHSGYSPNGALVQDRSGNFLTTALHGGAAGLGTLVRLDLSGGITVLQDFRGETNGASPRTGLVVGRDGNFYGITRSGGDADMGTFFRYSTRGAFASLADFHAYGLDRPSGLIRGMDGNFYGTTGGDLVADHFFRAAPGGRITNLGDLSPVATGSTGELIEESRGSFLGTATYTAADGWQVGNVFRTTTGQTRSSVASFSVDGGYWPAAGLTRGADGNYYGTTLFGGDYDQGTFYRMTPQGVITTLASFGSGTGSNPNVRLLLAADGNFYGTTSSGFGTVFRVSPGGQITTLHAFSGTDGEDPDGALLQATDGHLYGTTRAGGTTTAGLAAGGGEFYRIWLGALAEADAATGITWNGATLHGTVDPGDDATTVSFQYGIDPALKRSTTVKLGTIPAGDPVPVSTVLSRLQANRTYYFRVVTSNAENPVPQPSEILSFATPAR
ncbi:choice-of-anchor tandem repeat GloVer-containing protein [Luteolibacter sp. LG18]|uniref:choice-of-anchor tandem repeat GloVer-containing protein n=1 Tax=Luteolibacter sp. LG18 TaxID=2819286 RepID=UPI002B2E440B|nr:hypothetical protein llg_40110 [Luteolibacter sp. LG18]